MCMHAHVCFTKTLAFPSSANTYCSVEPSLRVHSQTQPAFWLPLETKGQKNDLLEGVHSGSLKM